MGILGTEYESFSDMFDGGGAGGSGDDYFSGSHQEYVDSGGTGAVAHNTSNDSGSNDNDSSPTTGSGNVAGADVTYTGTPGEGDFFVNDPSMIDPYEYLELIGGDLVDQGEKFEDGTTKLTWSFDNEDGSTVYGDNAAFDMSHYVKDENHKADAEFYTNNPNSTITTEQFKAGKKISLALGFLSGPLALGYRATIELQRRGLIPGNTATSWFEEKNIPETTGSDAENRIMAAIESGASSGEIKEQLNQLAVEQDLEGIDAAINAMSDAAFSSSNAKTILDDPVSYFSDFKLSSKVPTVKTDNVSGLDSTEFNLNDLATDLTTSQVNTEGAVNTGAVTTPNAAGYDVVTSTGQIQEADVITGEVGDKSVVTAEEMDVDATASGINALGKALNDFAKVDISRVVDTSTVSGKLLADKLGEGGYVDSKATILGQTKIIAEEFKGPNGEAVVPPWAQSIQREANKTIAFGDLSGSAQTAVMANAIMEATLGVAEKDASFFQTLTTENLSNKQESLIQRASVLANIELANLDNRQEAVVTNAKAFLAMDLQNLKNEQQTELLNTEIRSEALLTDTAAKNAERLFTAQTQADYNKFYDQMNTNISMHRDSILTDIAKFNAGEVNDNAQFRAELETRRDTFQKEMLFNIEKAVYEWEQTIALKETEMSFEAAKFDAQNLFNLTTDTLARTWDREDAFFDYIWKSAETEKERMVDLYEIDKEFEVKMRTQVSDEEIAKGKGDWEAFKWGTDLLLGDDFDIWDIV